MKTIVAYNTVTGNTEDCASWIKDCFVEAGCETEMVDASQIYPEILEHYDVIVLGCPTYNNGDVTVEFEPLLQGLSGMDLSQKKFAVFGLGDSEGYPSDFCNSVEMIEYCVNQCGAELATDSLRIDGDPHENREKIRQWVNEVCVNCLN